MGKNCAVTAGGCCSTAIVPQRSATVIGSWQMLPCAGDGAGAGACARTFVLASADEFKNVDEGACIEKLPFPNISAFSLRWAGLLSGT